ncbi:hypothetical protein AAVH_41149, partial [Aphelenchoides avenae]
MLNMNYGYRYLHPENMVLSPTPLRCTPYYANLPNKESTAYYSKLSKTYAIQTTDESQFNPHLHVPPCYAYYAAPEVLAGYAADLRKAAAFSVGVMLYDALMRTEGSITSSLT